MTLSRAFTIRAFTIRVALAIVLIPFMPLPFAVATAAACDSLAWSEDHFPGTGPLIEQWRADKHPLAGRVWGRNGLVPVDTEKTIRTSCDHHPLYDVVLSVLATVKAGGIVLLGEVHDNAGHHKLRAAILSGHTWLVTTGEGDPRIPTPGLVLEHIRADQQTGLDRFASFHRSARRLGTAGDFFRFVEWDKSGWPDTALFAPMITAAIRARLPILAGDPPRETVRRVAREGDGVLAPEERTRLKLDVALETGAQEALLSELADSHCGLMPKTAFGTMAMAQRYRDAVLADNVLRAHAKHRGAILLAGNGHVRTDRGVPWYLSQRAPQVPMTTVLLIEVEDGKPDPLAYGVSNAAVAARQGPIADWVIFTPRQSRPDPCEAMRAAMAAKKK